MPLRIDHHHVTNHPVVNFMNRRLQALQGPQLLAGHEDATRSLGSSHEITDLLGSHTYWLLAVNMLTGLERGDCHFAVKIGRRGNKQGLHILLFEDFLPI